MKSNKIINILLLIQLRKANMEADTLTNNNNNNISRLQNALLNQLDPYYIKLLIDSGQDVNFNLKRNHYRMGEFITPLQFACLVYSDWKKTYEVVKILVENGADVNLCDDNDEAPLHLIITKINYWTPYECYKKTIELLIESGSNYNMIDINIYKNLADSEKEEFNNYVRTRNIKPARKYS